MIVLLDSVLGIDFIGVFLLYMYIILTVLYLTVPKHPPH